MIRRLKTWLSERLGGSKPSSSASAAHDSAAAGPPRVRPRPVAPTARPQKFSPEVTGTIEDGGPGKNVLIRNRYLREETGTHDTLKIIDDSILDDSDEGGADPYNTGQFDRSKSWKVRNRK